MYGASVAWEQRGLQSSLWDNVKYKKKGRGIEAYRKMGGKSQ